MRKRIGLGLVLAVLAGGQTLIDLRTQSKAVDFSAASSTRPLKTGTALPATCVIGDLFFSTTAASGANVFGCVATNTWVVESSGGGQLTFKADGTTVGARAIANVVPGAGIFNSLIDTGTQINIQNTADTAVLMTRGSAQAGGVLRCQSGSASGSAYTCSMQPALNTYTSGMVVNWIPGLSAIGGATTLNIDTLGAKAIKLADGTTDPTAADIVSGRLYSLWYDGAQFRLPDAPGVIGVSGAAQVACSATSRGRVWFLYGGAGVADGFQVCAKNAAGVFAWRVLY